MVAPGQDFKAELSRCGSRTAATVLQYDLLSGRREVRVPPERNRTWAFVVMAYGAEEYYDHWENAHLRTAVRRSRVRQHVDELGLIADAVKGRVMVGTILGNRVLVERRIAGQYGAQNGIRLKDGVVVMADRDERPTLVDRATFWTEQHTWPAAWSEDTLPKPLDRQEREYVLGQDAILDWAAEQNEVTMNLAYEALSRLYQPQTY